MENEKEIELITVEAAKDSHRWVAITALLLAIGVILHTITPNVGGVTPNWTIAMYSIAIGITRPKFTQAIGIGLIAGMTIVPSSKSAFPLGNLASETAGACIAYVVTETMYGLKLGNFKFNPFITGFLSTMASGGVFTLILKFVLNLPWHVWIYAMLPLVAIIGLLNGVITQVLYPAVKKLFFVQKERK